MSERLCVHSILCKHLQRDTFFLEQIPQKLCSSHRPPVSLVLHEERKQIPLKVYPLSAGGRHHFLRVRKTRFWVGFVGRPFLVGMIMLS